jgi:hypothetical protein
MRRLRWVARVSTAAHPRAVARRLTWRCPTRSASAATTRASCSRATSRERTHTPALGVVLAYVNQSSWVWKPLCPRLSCCLSPCMRFEKRPPSRARHSAAADVRRLCFECLHGGGLNCIETHNGSARRSWRSCARAGAVLRCDPSPGAPLTASPRTSTTSLCRSTRVVSALRRVHSQQITARMRYAPAEYLL